MSENGLASIRSFGHSYLILQRALFLLPVSVWRSIFLSLFSSFFLWSSLDVFPIASAFFSCFSSTSVIFSLLSTVAFNWTKLYNWTNALNSFLMRCYIYSRNILSGCLYTIWTLKLHRLNPTWTFPSVQHYAYLNVLQPSIIICSRRVYMFSFSSRDHLLCLAASSRPCCLLYQATVLRSAVSSILVEKILRIQQIRCLSCKHGHFNWFRIHLHS